MEGGKKKVDPGWNDPPMLNYNAANPPPKSRITNKRVAFPLSQNSGTPTQKPIIPPMGLPPQNATTRKFEIPLDELYRRTTENFNKVVSNVDDNEIKSKIHLISIFWNEGQFPVNIQEYIYELSQNLVEKNASEVKALELKIAVEGGSSCTAWLPAIQQLADIK